MAAPLTPGGSAVLDGCPMPVAHGAHSFSPGWLADIARLGTGGQDRSVSGVRLMLVSHQNGVATGWALAAGNGQERWVAAWLCRTRAGVPGLQGPLDDQGQKPQGKPPEEWMAIVPSGGVASTTPILSACGCRGDEWLTHWVPADGAQVCPRPTAAPRAQRRWWSAARQVVETPCANLRAIFGLQYPGAHSTGGLLMRVAATVAADNLGILLNRLLGRPDFACATLIV